MKGSIAMKTYVKIDTNGIIDVEEINERFDTLRDAVHYADDHFNEDMDSFEVDIYNADTNEYIEYQTVERNYCSGDFVYAAWGFGIDKYGDGEYNWQDKEYDTLEELFEDEDYIHAKETGYGLRVEKYTQTVDENIGDVVDTYSEDD